MPLFFLPYIIFSTYVDISKITGVLLMEIYTDDGKKVFGQDRTSFWQTVDAYKAAIQYLLKKSPIYGK